MIYYYIMDKKINDNIYKLLIEKICELDIYNRQIHVHKLKEDLAKEFINDMNEYNYNRLNDFCKKYLEDGSSLFLVKGTRFVYFPNDYTFDDHDFFDQTGRFKKE